MINLRNFYSNLGGFKKTWASIFFIITIIMAVVILLISGFIELHNSGLLESIFLSFIAASIALAGASAVENIKRLKHDK